MNKKQAMKLVEVMGAVASVIKEVGSIPSGHLYAQLMGKMSFETYQDMIETMERLNVISVKNNLITYTANT
jgi:hypothetical protein